MKFQEWPQTCLRALPHVSEARSWLDSAFSIRVDQHLWATWHCFRNQRVRSLKLHQCFFCLWLKRYGGPRGSRRIWTHSLLTWLESHGCSLYTPKKDQETDTFGIIHLYDAILSLSFAFHEKLCTSSFEVTQSTNQRDPMFIPSNQSMQPQTNEIYIIKDILIRLGKDWKKNHNHLLISHPPFLRAVTEQHGSNFHPWLKSSYLICFLIFFILFSFLCVKFQTPFEYWYNSVVKCVDGNCSRWGILKCIQRIFLVEKGHLRCFQREALCEKCEKKVHAVSLEIPFLGPHYVDPVNRHMSTLKWVNSGLKPLTVRV